MEVYSSLLRERPSDVEFELFEESREKEFIVSYYSKFGELPPKEVFEKELEIELPSTTAPWRFYENKLREEKFIRDALPALVNFNKNYEKDQKAALLKLREQLLSLADPSSQFEPVSIIRDLSRYERFKDKDNARIPTGIVPLDKVADLKNIVYYFGEISIASHGGNSWLLIWQERVIE